MAEQPVKPETVANGWLQPFSDWADIYKTIHDLGTSGCNPGNQEVFAFTNSELMKKWLSTLMEQQSELNRYKTRNGIDPTKALMQLWSGYSRNLPLAFKDLLQTIQSARELSELNAHQVAAVERYLEAIKTHQLLFLDIARESLLATQPAFEEGIRNQQFESWFDQWSSAFEVRFADMALTDNYAKNFAELLHASLEVNANLVNPT